MSARHFTASRAPRQHQRGQALAEFTIAAAFVLIPLFLMIPLLGKFMDMKATTIQAARYAAWERTAWYGSSEWAVGQKSDAQIQSEVQQRFFSDAPTAPLRSTDQNQTGAVGGKQLWHDHAGTSMLSTYSAGAGQGGQTPGTMDVFLSGVQKIVNVIDSVLGTKFKLDMKSLYTSTVNLNTANTSAITLATGSGSSGFTAPNFVMSQVLVANGWSANGPDFVKAQTEGLAVLSLAQRSPVKEVMDIVQTVIGTFVEELKPSSLKLGGEILPDYVPPDRLTAVPAAAPAPKKTATQRRDEEAAKQKAEADTLTNRIQTKVNALNAAIVKTQNSINSCKADKQTEFDANYKECHDETYCSIDAGFLGCWEHKTRNVCTVKMPPGGWGTSYTPKADASVACHAGLDQQIADLQAKLNDPDLQLAKTKSDEQLAANPSLGNDPVFMAQRNSALNDIAAYQAQINDLQRQKNGI
jgi:hypothetical protein